MDMFNEYYDYKLKTINQYAMLLTKIFGIDNNKLWRRKKDVEDSINTIINIYIDKIINNTLVNKNFVRCFIDNKDITNYYLDNELMSTIEYFIDNNDAMEIPAYEKEIILVASIIKIANTLDISTSPFKKNKNNYNTIVTNLIERFNKIEFFNIIDDGHKATRLLIELVKTNVRKERKIFDILTSSNSFNRYINITRENKYYLAQYNYNVTNLNKFDKYAIKIIYEKDSIDDKFVSISADLIVITLMKLFSLRKNMKIFLLPVKEVFFEDENNLKKLKYIFENPVLRKYVFLLINYNDYNSEILRLLRRYSCTFYIYCSKNSKVADGAKLKDCNNYLASEDFYIKNKRTITRWEDDNANIIKEHFVGIDTDKELSEIE